MSPPWTQLRSGYDNQVTPLVLQQRTQGTAIPDGALASSERGRVRDVYAARLAFERVAIEVARAGRGDFTAHECLTEALVSVSVPLGVFLVENVDEAYLEAMLAVFACPPAK